MCENSEHLAWGSAFASMGGVTGFLNIVAATGSAALLLYSTDALFYYTDER